MLIKYQALASHLQKKIQSLYTLTGSDHYLLNDAALCIKKAWRQRSECLEKTITINSPSDWHTLREEANSYSLFAEEVLIETRFDKKAIDATGKEIINQYLKNPNPRCLILLHTHAVPAKQLQWLSNNEQACILQITSFSSTELKSWIITQLRTKSILFEPEIPNLIHQYTQGNMLACAQVIEKLSLIPSSGILTITEVKTQLTDQCEFQFYELADACLSANPVKAVQLLRKAHHGRSEPTLILWLLTQEIRLLIQLSYLLKETVSFSNACNQLKIWPQRARLYETTLARLPLTKLYRMLHDTKMLDEQIKSNSSQQIWHGFEQIALQLSLGI